MWTLRFGLGTFVTLGWETRIRVGIFRNIWYWKLYFDDFIWFDANGLLKTSRLISLSFSLLGDFSGPSIRNTTSGLNRCYGWSWVMAKVIVKETLEHLTRKLSCEKLPIKQWNGCSGFVMSVFRQCNLWPHRMKRFWQRIIDKEFLMRKFIFDARVRASASVCEAKLMFQYTEIIIS